MSVRFRFRLQHVVAGVRGAAVRAGQGLWRNGQVFRRPVLIAIQLALACGSNAAAFLLRFDGDVPADYRQLFGQTIPWLVAIRAVTFVPFRLYSGLWHYTGVSDVFAIVGAVGSSTLVAYLLFPVLLPLGYPRSILLIDAALLILALTGARLVTRVGLLRPRNKAERRVIIYGAGNAGEMIARDMRARPYGYAPVGFIDDDPGKVGRRIHGVPVLGGRASLAEVIAATRPHELLVAMPGAEPGTSREILANLRPFKVPITTLPGLRDILGGRIAVNQIRQLSITDLLARAPVDVDPTPVRRLIEHRRVLVTGAGGSIGSELARQIAMLKPATLVLYERYENGLHDLASELVDRFGAGWVWPVIGDVTDVSRVNQIMEEHRPHVVFHAAAHKHVPLMEHHPCEAVKNNVIGTMTVAAAADRWGVERFILISTDKAVNPSSTMGATKRVAELIVKTMSTMSPTRFATVRFGNVLGSNGSVLPRFLAQIQAGGPVTVTHPDIRRYFMLIPEAVQLVLHAGAHAESGVTYVLDMGEQIKLVDLARNVIRLAGFVPEKEIAIRFIGLRPGEKLSEELIGTDETAESTAVAKIVCVRGGPRLQPEAMRAELGELVFHADRGDAGSVIEQLRRIVPTFVPTGRPVELPTVASYGRTLTDVVTSPAVAGLSAL